MLQRITDLWPNLLGAVRVHDEGEEEGEENQGNSSSSEEDLLKIDEQQLLEFYNHLYWTRLISLEDYREGEDRKYPLGPDIVEECQAIANLEEEDNHSWAPLYEPTEFNEEHKPLKLEQYKLPKEDLLTWAE